MPVLWTRFSLYWMISDGNVCYFAIRALAAIGSPRAVEPLLAALHKYPRYSRYYRTALDTLCTLHDPRAVEPLLALLNTSPAAVSGDLSYDEKSCIDILGKLGDARAAPALLDVQAKGQYRLEAISALAAIGDPHARDLLFARFDADTRWVFCSAFQGVEGKFNDEGNVPYDEIALSGKLHESRAVPVLVLLLQEHNAGAAAVAAVALGRIGDPATVEALLGVLGRGASDNTRDFAGGQLRHAAARALGQMKTAAVRRNLQATAGQRQLAGARRGGRGTRSNGLSPGG